ncbi:hypothetical protein [Burkholderia sp. Ac-20379]|uniref:hypothetical protein n=1 Tax=Burkholderia sp. Ac-20379 TaxID=2703900 RepID=UPI00197D0332|nr:hypothetical protein [Burkholderia sp. Ac-20379]MBN3723266.1 hypothetical protein [Burkholderia sp. Ac-20379]
MTFRALVASPFLLAASTSLCMAATAGDYLNERTQSAAEVARVAAKGSDDATSAAQTKALDRLQTTLRGVIPPQHVKGFPAQGKITLQTLVAGEPGYGGLDGLVYAAQDDRKHLIATTRPLLDAWLKVYGHSVKLPANPAGVLSSGAFWGGAINEGGADAIHNANTVVKYADLPVKAAKAGAVAKAILFTQGEDEDPNAAPDLVGVALLQGERVYVRWDRTAGAPATSACLKAYQSDKADGSPGGAFAQCYGKRAAASSGFAAAVKQAQGIVDELSAAE